MRFNSAQIQKIGKEIRSKVDGKTLFDEFSRGRYSTDASVYQIKPLGVVLPKDTNDVLSLMEYSQKNSVPLLARGCLLYTSPSPRDSNLSRMPSSA